MISALDFIGFITCIAAFFMMVIFFRQKMRLPQVYAMGMLLLVTSYLNGSSAIEWLVLPTAGAGENITDYLQILQPVFWGIFFYVFVLSRHRSALAQNQESMRHIVENMPVILQALDKEGRILAWNGEAERVSGYFQNDVCGKQNILQQLYPDKLVQQALLEECKNGGGDYKRKVFSLKHREGKQRDIAWYSISEQHPIPGWATWAVGFDITDEIKIQNDLRYMATHDVLTGLPNRSLLGDRLDTALETCKKQKNQGALLLLDIDNFKLVNDSMGHSVGDTLLMHIANCLNKYLGDLAFVARFGGDEFLVLLENIKDKKDIESVVNIIFLALSESVELKVGKVTVESSIGIALFPDNGILPGKLIQHADLAMYDAKTVSCNSFSFFSPDMQKKTQDEQAISERLRSAIEDNELDVFYQPQISVADGRLVGSESLLRWNPGGDGYVSPGVFIPIAEKMGIIESFGNWVMESVCMQLSQWGFLHKQIPVAVNLSAKQFYVKHLAAHFLELTQRANITPELIELEITESVLMGNVEEAIRTMRDLRDVGFNFSLDDFGTGYSSLAYLKQFPINKIKIDQCFVRDIDLNSNNYAIVKSTIDLGHNLGMEMIAEGVENESEKDILIELGCEYIQGYLYSKPLPSDEFDHWRENRDCKIIDRIAAHH